MRPSAFPNAACLLLAAIALTPSALAGLPPIPALGGECDGVVDVNCDDTYDPCVWGDGCDPVAYRHCLVWLTYLDITWWEGWPPEICEDDPHYPGP